jgi:hypothetical protein
MDSTIVNWKRYFENSFAIPICADVVREGQVKFMYTAKRKGYVSLVEGDLIKIVRQGDPGAWSFVEINGTFAMHN